MSEVLNEDQSINSMTYESVDQAELDRVREKHAWIVEPIIRASENLGRMPFFEWLGQIKHPRDFKPAALQLYYHSATFPKVMGLMLGTTPLSENKMMPFYASHAYGEADHHEMLMSWMLQYNILQDREEINEVILTPETNACINLAYQLAIEQDRRKWLVAVNSGIERCSNQFFKAVAPKMHELGAGDDYFDVHVEADEHHSIMGMDYIDPQDPETTLGKHLIAKALEGITLWGAMIHSWIGLDIFPVFDLYGNLKERRRLPV